eukprot:TRINITY_DN240_c0_g2_i1.p1 TRINITY_DN240_c0_g2~~TRINITY_DN240_c0_g2_i1.p1  ORF type:complete len:627 (+),score=173.80 TRINITY_DN240_c0_g2_i1:195-1883(+)
MFEREQVVSMAALLLHVVVGVYDENRWEDKLDEPSRVNFIPVQWRREPGLDIEILKQYQQYSNNPLKESKRKFIELIRLVRRTNENIFQIYIYSADKIETREAILVVGEEIHIFDSENQSPIHNFPVQSVVSICNQHTSKNEREKLRRQLGHVSKLHQMVIEVDKGSIIRILAIDREAIRRRIDASIDISIESEREKQYLQSLSQNVPAEPLETTSSFLNAEEIISWEFHPHNVSVKDVFVKVIGKSMVIISAFNEEMLHEISGDWIKSWHTVAIDQEIRKQLSKTMNEAAFNIHQIEIDFGSLQKPIHLLVLDKNKILKILNTITAHSSIRKEEYIATVEFSERPGQLTNVLIKFYSDVIQFHNLTDRTVVMKVPIIYIDNLLQNPMSENQKTLFASHSGDILVLTLKSSKVVINIASHEMGSILEQFKKSLAEMDVYLKNLDTMTSKNEIKAKLFNGLVSTKKLSLLTDKEKLIINSIEDGCQYTTLDMNQIQSWTLVLKPLSTSHVVLLTSAKPNEDQEEQMQNLISLLAKPETKPEDQNTTNYSGSDIEIDSDLSNSE